MAAPGGRRTHHTTIYLSWPEANAFEALRALDSHLAGSPLSRADWLLRTIEPRLRQAPDDATLPVHLRTRCRTALEALDRERAHRSVHRPGRPPSVY